MTIRRVELHAILREAHGESGLNPGWELVGLHDDGTGVTALPGRVAAGHLAGRAAARQAGRGLPHHRPWRQRVLVAPRRRRAPLDCRDQGRAGTWTRDVHQTREALLALIADWSFPVPDLISSADEEVIVVRGVHDRPPRTTWSRGRVTLLGDAAHPMTNSLGQGANTALEDAVVLARCLAASHDPVDALRTYEQERIPRTTRIVLRSAETSERSRAGAEANPYSDDFADWLYGYSPRA